jgi:osmotically-inducible protein OsmY
MVAVVDRKANGIAEEVARELAADRVLEGYRLGVDEADGGVILSGAVDCYARRREAEEAAYRVRGVSRVVNEIEVLADFVHGFRDFDMIQEAPHLFTAHYLLRGKGLHTRIERGHAILTGRVETIFEREEAERMVAMLPSLRAVENRIVVAPRRIAAEEIARAVEGVVARTLGQGAESVEVSVETSTVTLSGSVRSRAEKQICLAEVAKTHGIAEIVDALNVDA